MQKLFFLFSISLMAIAISAQTSSYTSLLSLHKELKQLERITLPDGVPDYRRQTIAQIQQALSAIKNKHAQIDTSAWPLEQKVNYVLLLSEINALDYNCRILKPWERDPSFYALLFAEQSDVPAHEGPTSIAAIDIWNYTFPLSADDDKKLTAQLKVIPPLYKQATINLTGNARDLWRAGIEDMKGQLVLLDELANKTNSNSAALKTAIGNAKMAATTFLNWLQKKLPSKNGPSGIGKENYT